ncbi:MAG: glycosyltransferase family 4 protein [Thermoplasmata archaeon]|nr:glycosyltransferase family 4 protein [Thermoplasmata archaeon]MCI4359816.1 glycosyltransferase family 4 protein [Thermoplasmata archaeon]
MRVAQVTLRFDAPGGVETTVRELSSRLRSKGESVEVYASDLLDEASWERRLDFPPAVDGVPVHRFRVYKRLLPGLTMPLFVGLVDSLAHDRPDVIHAHSHRYGHVLESALVAHAQRLPLVVSTHYHPAHPSEPRAKKSLLRLQDHLFGMSAYRVARALIVETEQEAKRVSEFAPRSRIRVIPPGIDLTAWPARPEDRPPAGLPERYLLYAGRVAPNKGLTDLVAAMGRIPASRRLPLVLMGRDWGTRSDVERRCRELGLDPPIFTGHVADPGQYRAAFRGGVAFVLPSEYEAFGLVLLEAMASGVPVIATAVGGVPEVLEGGKAGLLVPPRDLDALAGAIETVAGDPSLRERLRAAGLERVRAFDWERAVEAHRAVYRECTGTG